MTFAILVSPANHDTDGKGNCDRLHPLPLRPQHYHPIFSNTETGRAQFTAFPALSRSISFANLVSTGKIRQYAPGVSVRDKTSAQLMAFDLRLNFRSWQNILCFLVNRRGAGGCFNCCSARSQPRPEALISVLHSPVSLSFEFFPA